MPAINNAANARLASALVEPFNPALIITDEEFNDAGAMNCDQVQAFLNERKGVLKGYAVDGKPAAQLICENAARYGVNPRVLLVMMQKEMGLLTDTEPTPGALNWAMGCGPGWASTKGFATNVECGAKTLRRYFDKPGLGQESVEGVLPSNKATLALYRYTEHVQGNKDFYDIWTNYFSKSAASGIPPEIMVDSKSLELAPVTKAEPACRYGWAAGKKGFGNHFIATPNAATAADSTNKAVWRPTILRDGAYRVLAYIPNHEALSWACGPIAAKADTSRATYTIKHRDGIAQYVVNQAPLNDEWVDLGSYYFSAGTANIIELSDFTGEPSNSRWVVFDEIKLVWLQP